MQKQLFLIHLYSPDYHKKSEQVEKDMRRAWEMLVNYFGQKCQLFRCYFSDQEFFLRELKLIEPLVGQFKPAPEFGQGWLKAECQITPEFLEALIKSPTFEGISPLFDFKFYKGDEETFICADHGCDILFLADEQEKKEVESLLNQATIYFELDPQKMSN